MGGSATIQVVDLKDDEAGRAIGRGFAGNYSRYVDQLRG